MSGVLKVNLDELRRAGATFTAVGDKLAGIEAGAPLGDAASAVSGLQTASACDAAKDAVSEQMSANVAGTRTYGANVTGAADKYEATDRASGGKIAAVDVPSFGTS
ncbi:excreted virulence factor EspC (type VII ESX diderm) [Mycobacterium sp. BK558]|nr:excreted virulence factor EspC (type VII ESX diderm) [Mycobacterium sp. BK558]